MTAGPLTFTAYDLGGHRQGEFYNVSFSSVVLAEGLALLTHILEVASWTLELESSLCCDSSLLLYKSILFIIPDYGSK